MFKEVIKTIAAAMFCGVAAWVAITMVGNGLEHDRIEEASKQKIIARAFCDMAMVGGASQKCIDGREKLYHRDPVIWSSDKLDYSDGIMGN